ncbi:hypothetical protein DFH07DRAFT_957024 [Mycena maculata]|uniref:MYND-type domain-containing protein n=1 Tax=Mycena maculata TaxID=230809 RepID=A0AAD7NIX7_9AGAR|nr:hypothetical protein DFH07DRAFT_957024 [Mycena maculata]
MPWRPGILDIDTGLFRSRSSSLALSSFRLAVRRPDDGSEQLLLPSSHSLPMPWRPHILDMARCSSTSSSRRSFFRSAWRAVFHFVFIGRIAACGKVRLPRDAWTLAHHGTRSPTAQQDTDPEDGRATIGENSRRTNHLGATSDIWSVRYCARDCQVAHYKASHKKACANVAAHSIPRLSCLATPTLPSGLKARPEDQAPSMGMLVAMTPGVTNGKWL